MTSTPPDERTKLELSPRHPSAEEQVQGSKDVYGLTYSRKDIKKERGKNAHEDLEIHRSPKDASEDKDSVRLQSTKQSSISETSDDCKPEVQDSLNPPGPIFSLASDCDDLFRECILQVEDVESVALVSLNEYKKRFMAWSKFSGVFASSKVNLDRRLRSKPSIENLIVRLLLSLRRNLAQLKTHLVKSTKGVWIHSFPPALKVNVKEEELEEPITYHSGAIDEALEGLSNVSLAIRASSRVTETSLARRLMSDRPELHRYDILSQIMLETLYPSAPQTLLTQLHESMVSRYARHLYRAPIQAALEQDVRILPVDTQSPGRSRQTQDNPDTEYSPEQPRKVVSGRVHLQMPSTLPSVRPSQFSGNLRATKSPVRPSPTLVRLGRVYGPPLPTFDATTGQGRCAWCFGMIDIGLIENGRWNPAGIAHYENDLEPFPCISELCSSPGRSFCSRTEWAEHMLKHHPRWPQYIHSHKIWRCEKGSLDSGTHESIAYFSSEDHFMNHVAMIHPNPERNGMQRSELLQMTEEFGVDPILDENVCPLCYMTPQDLQPKGPKSMQNHIADHLQILLLLSLRLITISAHNPNDAEDNNSHVTAVYATQSSIDAADADQEEVMAGLPSPPSGSPRPSSPDPSSIPVDEAGSWEIITNDIRENHPLQVTDMDKLLLVRTEEKRILQAAMDSLRTLKQERKTLDAIEDHLYSAFTTSTFDVPERDFLPSGSLSDIVTQDAILTELEISAETNQSGIEYKLQLARWILTSAPALFATVAQCSLDRRDTMVSMAIFHQNNFGDEKLPLEDLRIKRPPSELFRESIWTRRRLSDFYRNQWQFIVTTFSAMCYNYDLAATSILPFTGDMRDVVHGGFSSVRKVNVHPNHCVGLKTTEFALKEIRTTYGSDRSEINVAWENEARVLRLVNKIDHPHIVTCAAAIRRGDQRYFMFPWADGGTLRDLWMQSPRRESLHADLVLACIEQLRGLADALVHMHYYKIEGEEDDPELKDSLEAEEDSTGLHHQTLSIRHGDLKPENILHFSNHESLLGLLTITDLAVAKQHVVATEERRQATRTRYGTVHYEAPEAVTARYGRSRLYDIWSMGCITLEFIIWLLYGNDCLDEFYDDLKQDSSESPHFYEVSRSSNDQKVVVHHIIIRWMDFINNSDPECAQRSAISDLLKIVRTQLLVVDLPSSRPRKGLKGPQVASIAGPVIRVFAPEVPEPGDANTTQRATAIQFRDALDQILAKASDQAYLLLQPSREHIKSPSGEGRQISELKSLGPEAVGTLTDVQTNVQRGDYSYPPLDLWYYDIHDNFAEKVFTRVDPATIMPKATGPSELCNICTNLDFMMGGFMYRWDISDVKRRAAVCGFCRMIEKVHPPNFKECTLERRGSNLTLLSYSSPSFTIVCTLKLLPPINILQLGFPQLPKPGSQPFNEILRLWIDDCDESHQDCISLHYDRLPTRLIDVGSHQGDNIRLIETKSEIIRDRRFIALSHCWGPSNYTRFVTRAHDKDGHDVENFKKSIPFDQLPATFRDAVICTRALGVRYLWIDAICIVFGSGGDFIEETSRMEEVFGGAYCVIAASNSLSQHGGFLNSRSPREYVTFARQDSVPLYICDFIDDFDGEILASPLNQRAWVLQERALARRTIYFGKNQTYFECGQGIRCESLTKMRSYMTDFLGDARFPEKVIANATKGQMIQYVQKLFQQYSTLEMSFPGDRPVAIGAIERRLIQALGIEGGFGILEDTNEPLNSRQFLISTLLWSRDEGYSKSLVPIAFEDQMSHVPSWSWMAYEGAINYLLPPNELIQWEADYITYVSAKVLYGRHHLWAPVKSFTPQVEPTTKVIYDTLPDPYVPRSHFCVVLARSKDTLGVYELDRRCYVLLVDRVQGEPPLTQTEELNDVFRRIGVGYMPARQIQVSVDILCEII